MHIQQDSIEAIEERLAPLRVRLNAHPLYAAIQSIEDLRIFMESHVWAVWDFMSLLKCLQRGLTCVEVPWRPSAYPASRRFINEIVLGEESDLYEGRPVSHFEIYVEAMRTVGADTTPLQALTVGTADWSAAPLAARTFVDTTFRLIREGSLAAQAAAFTFGREDAIPEMFRALVRELNHAMGGDLAPFVWYLERHIEVDGEDHGPLALRMVADLCGNDAARWDEAAQAAEDAVRARVALWDGILRQIEQKRAG